MKSTRANRSFSFARCLSNSSVFGITCGVSILLAAFGESKINLPDHQTAEAVQEEAQEESGNSANASNGLNAEEARRLSELNEKLQLVYLTKGERVFGSGDGTNKAMMGVHTRQADATLRSQLGLNGVFGLVVEHVTPKSGAEAAGVQLHDVLWKVDGQLLVNQEQFRSLIESKKIGESVKLVFFRGGKHSEIEVSLMERQSIAKDSSILDLEHYHQVRLAGDDFVHSEAVLKFNDCKACHTTIDGNDAPFWDGPRRIQLEIPPKADTPAEGKN